MNPVLRARARAAKVGVIESLRGPRVLLLGPARTAVSGVATHLNQLFGSQLSSGFCLTQFQVGSEGRAEHPAGLALRLLTSPFAFILCVLRTRPRIVHINTSFEPKGYWRDIVYLVLAKLMGRKVVYQIHGGALPAEFFPNSRILTLLLRHVLRWPDAVVLLAKSEITAYRSFAPRARLVRIANAVAPCEVDLAAGRYMQDRPLEIVYLGRFAVNKGILETIAAVKILRDRGVRVNLTIGGSGPAESEISRAIDAGQLADRVCVAGAVYGDAKQRLWRQADVFAFPTYHREGLPYALLEAMAAGAVPVASQVGAIPDVMQHEVHGLFVPAHDPQAVATALERLASDRRLLHRLALNARKRVYDQYSIARLAEEFADLYTGLAN